METKTYHIEGMSCNHCRMAAEKALMSVPGVEKASVDLVSKEADEALLSKAIEDAGFNLTK